LYNIISANAGLEILESNGKIASEAVEILENSKSTATEIENAINNLNLIFGSELFTAEDIGTEKLTLLK
jgi:hypothetical protein